MILNKFSKLLLAATVVSVAFLSCEKDKHIDEIKEVPEAARFNALSSSGSFFINEGVPGGDVYKIPVSISTVSSVDRTLDIIYTSSTGAASGVQYSAPATVTIPAGEVSTTLEVTGLIPGYATPGRKDVLKIKIASPDTIHNKGSFNLTMQKYCNVVLANLGGPYANTFEGTYGPYTSSVNNLTMVPNSTTKATATITNIYDSNISATATFDWTNPAAFVVTIAAQATQYTSGGLPLFVRGNPTVPSTFSSCDNTITLNLQLYTSAGIVDSWTSSMAK